MDHQLRTIIESCLSIRPHDRPTPGDLLQSTYFTNDLEALQFTNGPPNEALLLRCPLKHIYHWWQLAGGDVPGELMKAGLIRSEAPILKMPMYSLTEIIDLSTLFIMDNFGLDWSFLTDPPSVRRAATATCSTTAWSS